MAKKKSAHKATNPKRARVARSTPTLCRGKALTENAVSQTASRCQLVMQAVAASRRVLEAYSNKSEEGVIREWKEKKIPERGAAAKKGAKPYYMMDGPPYASGHIHMGTALNKILKDVAIRSKRMNGFEVDAQPGYDTHGVPIEFQIEKNLGITNKKDIEKFGVEKFIGECRKFATQYISSMNSEFLDLGIWMNWEKPYLTLSKEYIEGIWWTFKRADEQGYLYLGNYPVHICPRCETAVAYNEIEYAKQTDNAIYVKFPAKGEENKFFIIWTTTPWTLPGNTGIMVHPDFDYAEVKVSNGETWIIAKERTEQLMKAMEAGFTIERVFKGKELEGKEYINPLLKNMKLQKLDKAYRIITSERYVNLEDGSGLVHTAPGHGKEDYDAGTKAGLPAISPVNLDGTMKEETGKYAGGKARIIDKEIISDLEIDGLIVYKHSYTHDYPLCWRCKSSLLMMSVPQWFFAVEKLRKRMLELNEEVTWVPDWGQARFKNWLESLGDWPISRQRYWGTPLPIWVCGKCNDKKVFASAKELAKESGMPELSDLHKPWVDEVTIKCKCGGTMKRVPEVMDVWFDSGCSSWASLDYPKEKKSFEKHWPADLNIEGSDQIRGWWNSQMITSTICFDKKPYKTIVMHGMVLDLSKKKMSKSLGNAVTPKEVIEKTSRDALRFYVISQARGGDIVFDWEEFKKIGRLFNTLINSYNYLAMYSAEGMGKEDKGKKAVEKTKHSAVSQTARGLPLRNGTVEDKWITSKLHSLAGECSRNYEKYDFYKVAIAIDYFVVEELSRTYIKLIRDRIDEGDYSGLEMLKETLLGVLRLFAPIAPHITEYIYKELGEKDSPESIHLCGMMESDGKKIDEKLEKEMDIVKKIAQDALSLREKNSIRLRWPLEELIIVTKDGNTLTKAKEILAKTCNVKKIIEAKEKPRGNYAELEGEGYSLHLNTSASEELKEEWEFMEARRRVQALRKDAGLMPKDKVKLAIYCSDKKFIEKHSKRLGKETNTTPHLQSSPTGEKEKLFEREFTIKLEK